MKQVTLTEIKEFWKWFESISDQFGDKFENRDLINELDVKIRNISPVAWEVGPGIKNSNSNSLVITPCGDVDLLPITKAIIENAPNSDNWEFYYSKQPKKWHRKFILKDENGVNIQIDASNWEYAMLQYEDGIIDLIIKAPEIINNNNTDFQDTAAVVVVDSEIGEDKRIRWIESIEIVDNFEKEFLGNENPISLLNEHFDRLIDDYQV